MVFETTPFDHSGTPPFYARRAKIRSVNARRQRLFFKMLRKYRPAYLRPVELRTRVPFVDRKGCKRIDENDKKTERIASIFPNVEYRPPRPSDTPPMAQGCYVLCEKAQNQRPKPTPPLRGTPPEEETLLRQPLR